MKRSLTLFCFSFLRYLYRKGLNRQDGFLVGVFMSVLFSIRFLVEFVKESQGALRLSFLHFQQDSGLVFR